MDAKNYRILIVDDHALLRQIVTTAVKGLGITAIDQAGDGEAALTRIKQAFDEGAPYQVVFLDWNMPKMSGYDLLKACRGDPKFNDMAMVMVTSESEDANIVKALEAGATAYIVKPFKPDAVAKKMDDIIKWRKTRTAGAA